MLTLDRQVILSFIMIELLGTVLLLLAVTIFVYTKRRFVRKSLTGCNVLITNDDSALSRELAELLSTKHGCQAILLHTNSNADAPNTVRPTSNGIPTICCNPLDIAELKQTGDEIERQYGRVDVIIDNGISSIATEHRLNCGTFVDYTSNRLRATINLLMHFIPKMGDLSRGHFVTVQATNTNKSSILSSYDEMKVLINHLTDQPRSTFSLELFKQRTICLSTVIWTGDVNAAQADNNNDDRMRFADARQLAEQIVDGICANRSVIRIDHKSSFTDTHRTAAHIVPNKTQNL